MISVTFDCGHVQEMSGSETEARCRACGSTSVQRVLAPAPTFTGHARGPCAVYKDLPATEVKFEVPNA